MNDTDPPFIAVSSSYPLDVDGDVVLKEDDEDDMDDTCGQRPQE